MINADVAILAGTNTTANHPVASSFFKQARRRGTKLIVVDPRRERIADHADIYCQIKPGTDVAFYNGVMHAIIEMGLTDEEFIAARTSNYEALVEMLERVSARARQPDLRDLAAHVARGGAPVGRGRVGGRLLGDGHLSAHHRHRQRPLPDRAVLHHRAGRPPGDRPAPAARPEQRAGRVGRRADPDVLSRLSARRPPGGVGALRARLGPGAGPRPRADGDRDRRRRPEEGRARHVHDGREPVPIGPQHQQGPQGAERAGLPGRPGHLPDRDRGVRRRDPARVLIPGEGWLLHQHRPPRPARPQGARPARGGACGLGDHPGHRQPGRP